MHDILHGAIGCPSYDEQCQQDVCAALLATAGLDATRIGVGLTASGHVTLSGIVRSKRQRDLALRIARRCAGRRKVISHLRLS
jgi:osmotically-inducible protein OsmY